jgi:hypothetical protein
VVRELLFLDEADGIYHFFGEFYYMMLVPWVQKLVRISYIVAASRTLCFSTNKDEDKWYVDSRKKYKIRLQLLSWFIRAPHGLTSYKIKWTNELDSFFLLVIKSDLNASTTIRNDYIRSYWIHWYFLHFHYRLILQASSKFYTIYNSIIWRSLMDYQTIMKFESLSIYNRITYP